MTDKLISIDQAASMVQSGSTISIGGMTLYRRPIAFILTLIKRYIDEGNPNDLTLLSFTASIGCDWLVGSGMISRVRTCYFGLEIFGLAPMFTHLANRGQIKIIEETEASLAFGLRATMAGIGFMPGRGWLGTDLPKLRADVKTVIDPYNQEELIAFPAIKPDIAIIHALQADREGNAVIGKNKGIDEELALSSDQVVVIAEEIVEPLKEADLVAPLIDAVVHSPGGARPTSCHPLYPLNGVEIQKYSAQVKDFDSLSNYLTGII